MVVCKIYGCDASISVLASDACDSAGVDADVVANHICLEKCAQYIHRRYSIGVQIATPNSRTVCYAIAGVIPSVAHEVKRDVVCGVGTGKLVLSLNFEFG